MSGYGHGVLSRRHGGDNDRWVWTRGVPWSGLYSRMVRSTPGPGDQTGGDESLLLDSESGSGKEDVEERYQNRQALATQRM